MSDAGYHHGNLREALIDSAVASVRERGAESLSLRDLARRVGVSHNAAYRHFAGRDDLVAEVAGRVMERLVQTMQRRLDTVDVIDPVLRARRRLAETGRGYVEFALAEPGLFRLAFSSVQTLSDVGRPLAGDPLALLARALDDLVEVGFLSADARVDAEVTCWSAVHGFSVLSSEGGLSGASDRDRDAALARVLVAIDRSYGASTGQLVSPGDLFTGGPRGGWNDVSG